MKNQKATAMYEIYVRQEWARANDLTGTIKLSEYLMGTTTDRTLVDSGEGTYVWDHLKDACPDTLVSLYRGRIKVLTNYFLHGWHGYRVWQRQEPSCRSGVEGDHGTVRASGADNTHQEHCCVLPPHGTD